MGQCIVHVWVLSAVWSCSSPGVSASLTLVRRKEIVKKCRMTDRETDRQVGKEEEAFDEGRREGEKAKYLS